MMTTLLLGVAFQLIISIPYVPPFMTAHAQLAMPRMVNSEAQKDLPDTEQPMLKWNEL